LFSFNLSVVNELPFHSGCYEILRVIIEEEMKKKREGLGMQKTDFLTKLCTLAQLIALIERSWEPRGRTLREFTDYFNNLVAKEKGKFPRHGSPVLYDSFLKRWNDLSNPQWDLGSSGAPPGAKRKRVNQSASSGPANETNRQVSDIPGGPGLNVGFESRHDLDSNPTPTNLNSSPGIDFTPPSFLFPSFDDSPSFSETLDEDFIPFGH